MPADRTNAIAFVWMDIWEDRAGWPGRRPMRAALAAGGIMLALLAGCASPAPPLPPSLKLPEVVTDLTATRVGAQVMLRWTTPTHTTDKLLIRGPVTAEICRETPPAAAGPVQSRGQQFAEKSGNAMRGGSAGERDGGRDRGSGCAARGAGARDGTAAEVSGATEECRGTHGGAFAGGFCCGGRGAGTGGRLARRGDQRRRGAGVAARAAGGWRRDGGAGADGRGGSEPTQAGPGWAAAAPQRMDALPGAGKEPAEERFRAGPGATDAGGTDAGGTIDRTALIGYTYRYSAQRVRKLALGGQTLEVRSVPSAGVTVAVQDVFPPQAPTGLVAVPGIETTGAEQQSVSRSIDLSWDPNMEPRVAGYRVYRREADHPTEPGSPGTPVDTGAWTRLNAELVQVPAYRDLTVMAGKTYTYQVTAVSDTGVESKPSGEVTETAPSPAAP